MHAPPDPAVDVPDPDPDGARPDYVRPYFGDRIDNHVLVSDKENDGLRLTIIRVKPGTVLPRHSHSVDYIEFVLEGEVHFGNKVIKAGGGVFRPAGAVYTYQVGPEGATIADIRAHTFYSTTWADPPDQWPPHGG
jgi:quercetin dioxygenase-like cupin family protein